MKDLNSLLESEIKEIYAAEKLLLETFPKILEASTYKKLIKQLAKDLNKTEEQYTRIQKICAQMEINPGSTKSKILEEIINQYNSEFNSNASEEVRDSIIASNIRKIRHYEISVYETAYRYAKELKLKKTKKKLKKIREQKIKSEEKLLKISKKKLIPKVYNS